MIGVIFMMRYKYQMHTHTYPCSDCSRLSPEELVESLVAGGYTGCVLTNHFFHGNTGIDRSLSWKKFVSHFEKDYLLCKKLGEEQDLDILFGIEEGVGGGLEILCYGITPQTLYQNPQLAFGSLRNWYEVLDRSGALCIQAHPYRERDYIPHPALLPPKYIHGIEVYNVANSEKNNLEAQAAAKEHPQWILVAGADCHDAKRVCMSGIATHQRIRTEEQLAQVLKNGDYKLL